MNDLKDKKGMQRSEKIKSLIEVLGEKDGLKRREARFELEKIGRIATPYLIEALHNSNHTIRWEAAKALGTIKDPEAGPALVEALMDSSFEVQWLAAEALIALKEQAIVPILRALVNNYGSAYIRQGAHHILHALERENRLDDYTLKALDEVRELEPEEPYPMKAKRALEHLTEGKSGERE
jgi:HEAT repeat protein